MPRNGVGCRVRSFGGIYGRKDAEPEPLTLGTLFDIYGEEVTPAKGSGTRKHDRTTMEMFLGFFGQDRNPATLSQRDWDRFIRARRQGQVGPSGRPVSDRTIGYDLKLLIAIFNWAAKSRDERGELLLDRNPLMGLRTPREKNPTRVVLAEDEYQALLGVGHDVDWRFHVALVLAHETGHRIGAIRKLRWHDIDFGSGVVRWRAEHEKTGYEHTTPVTAEALVALAEARKRKIGGGDAPVLPASGNPSACVGSRQVRSWWCKAQKLAGLEPKRGQGLALAEAEVRVRPHGPAAEGALRSRRLEDGEDGPALLPASRRGTTQEGAGRPPPGAQLKSQAAGTNQRE